jgi:hypothetical protein
MMITVNVVNDTISGSYNGKPFGIQFSEQKYAQMKDMEAKANAVSSMEELTTILEDFELLTKEDYKELVEHAAGGQFLWVSRANGKIFLAINGKVSSIAIPKTLVDRIITSVEKKIDVLPLVKCWARYIRPIAGRPAYTAERGAAFAHYISSTYTDPAYAAQLVKENGLSQEVANTRATNVQVSITQEGLLNCFKVSREILTRYELNEDEDVVQKSRYTKSVDPDSGLVTYDEPKYVEERLFEPAIMGKRGDEFYCGDKPGHFIRVGQTHYLDSWDKVGVPGQKGCHIGGLKYIAGYQTEGTVTHNVFADPMDIHTVNASEHSDGAMTVKRYFVHSSFAGVNKGIYHSSEYAKLTDAEYAKLIEEAVEASQQAVDQIAADLDERKNLL